MTEYKPGDKLVVTRYGETYSDGQLREGQEYTFKSYGASFKEMIYVKEIEGLFQPDAFAPATKTDTYADLIHFAPLLKIQKAFEDLNAALSEAGHDIGMWLEVPDITVVSEGEDYARVRYADGEVLVTPLFSLVREWDDR